MIDFPLVLLILAIIIVNQTDLLFERFAMSYMSRKEYLRETEYLSERALDNLREVKILLDDKSEIDIKNNQIDKIIQIWTDELKKIRENLSNIK